MRVVAHVFQSSGPEYLLIIAPKGDPSTGPYHGCNFLAAVTRGGESR